jgi:PST family polysaccharide transporter
MIDKLKKGIDVKLVSNLMSLFVLQGSNYILPLVTVPYLVRVVGASSYGTLALIMATMSYCVLVADYGFNLSATRKVSINRGDTKILSEIFSSVIYIKFILMIIVFSFLLLLGYLFEGVRGVESLYLLAFIGVFGQVIFPMWFFQGVEDLRVVTYFDLLVKLIFTVPIFFVVNEPSDLYKVVALTSCGTLLSGIFAMVRVGVVYKVGFRSPSISLLRIQLIEGWYIFYSTLAISMYKRSSIFILGAFASSESVGYFAAGEKIVKAVQGLYGPVSQIFYPYISKAMMHSISKGILIISRLQKYVGIVMGLVSVTLFFYAEQLVFLLLGAEFFKSVVVVQIMSPIPFLIAMSNIYGIQGLLNLDEKKVFSRIVSTASVVGVILLVFMSYYYEMVGVSITLLMIELMVTVVMAYYYYLAIKKEREVL